MNEKRSHKIEPAMNWFLFCDIITTLEIYQIEINRGGTDEITSNKQR